SRGWCSGRSGKAARIPSTCRSPRTGTASAGPATANTSARHGKSHREWGASRFQGLTVGGVSGSIPPCFCHLAHGGFMRRTSVTSATIAGVLGFSLSLLGCGGGGGSGGQGETPKAPVAPTTTAAPAANAPPTTAAKTEGQAGA